MRQVDRDLLKAQIKGVCYLGTKGILFSVRVCTLRIGTSYFSVRSFQHHRKGSSLVNIRWPVMRFEDQRTPIGPINITLRTRELFNNIRSVSNRYNVGNRGRAPRWRRAVFLFLHRARPRDRAPTHARVARRMCAVPLKAAPSGIWRRACFSGNPIDAVVRE